jgi:hypothetical protein
VTPVRVVAAPSPGAARAGNGEVAMYRPGRGWNTGRRAEARSGVRDDGRFAPRADRDFTGNVRGSPERQDRAVQGGPPAPRQDRGFLDNARIPREREQDRTFMDDVRAQRREREQARSWNPPAPSAAPAPTPRQQQDAPRFVPRANGSHDAAPRAERSWSPGGGRGGGDGAPRVMAPSRGGGDRGGGGERRGHR